MLVKPPLEKLLTKIENRYSLACVTASRTRQLVAGAKPLTYSKSPNLVTLACEELGADAIIPIPNAEDPYIPLRPEIEEARRMAIQEKQQEEVVESEEIQVIENKQQEEE